MMKKLQLIIPIVCLIGLAILLLNSSPSSKGEVTEKNQSHEKITKVEKNDAEVVDSTREDKMHIYFIAGESNSGATLKALNDGEVIERCFQFNEKNEWEPVIDKQLPEHAFARKMLAQNKKITIGLVSSKVGNTKIESWIDPKSPEFRGVRKLMKLTTKDGIFKGILWFQGNADKENTEGVLENLKKLATDFRVSIFGDPSFPVVVGQIQDSPEIQAQIAKLPQSVHLAGVASSEGLTSVDGVRDAKSHVLLGERYAEQMIQVQAAYLKSAGKPPTDMKFIDPHVHAMSVTPLGLRDVAKWMDACNVERCIVSPLMHKGSHPQNEEEYKIMLDNFRPYKGKIDRMCVINAGDVKTADEAVAILKREMADGAIGFGEHYGVGLMFDDPKNLMLYEACEKVGLPVMFHIDQNKNMVEQGMERVDNVLKKYPNCKLVAHAYWWRQLANGTCDRQLQEHPNLYADMSGGVVINVLNRDRAYAREFLIRNQNKILWATDEGWWSFNSDRTKIPAHYTFFEELDLPDEVRRKIYRENSEKVYGLKK